MKIGIFLFTMILVVAFVLQHLLPSCLLWSSFRPSSCCCKVSHHLSNSSGSLQLSSLLNGFSLCHLRPFLHLFQILTPAITWILMYTSPLFLYALNHCPCFVSALVLSFCPNWVSQMNPGLNQNSNLNPSSNLLG